MCYNLAHICENVVYIFVIDTINITALYITPLIIITISVALRNVHVVITLKPHTKNRCANLAHKSVLNRYPCPHF